MLVPSQGNVAPTSPVLRPTGFDWVARRGLRPLVYIGVLALIGVWGIQQGKFWRAAGLIAFRPIQMDPVTRSYSQGHCRHHRAGDRPLGPEESPETQWATAAVAWGLGPSAGSGADGPARPNRNGPSPPPRVLEPWADPAVGGPARTAMCRRRCRRTWGPAGGRPQTVPVELSIIEKHLDKRNQTK